MWRTPTACRVDRRVDGFDPDPSFVDGRVDAARVAACATHPGEH